MSVNLLTEHRFEFLSLKGGCTGSSESTLVKMPHYLKSHVSAIAYAINMLKSCKLYSCAGDLNFGQYLHLLPFPLRLCDKCHSLMDFHILCMRDGTKITTTLLDWYQNSK